MPILIEFLNPYIFGYILFGYLFGTIPFGLIICAIFGYGDIRKIGSGNIGATNVLRTGNKLLAALTLILDSAKGVCAFIMVYVLAKMLPSCAMINCIDTLPVQQESQVAFAATIAAFSAALGHMFPIWLKFRGGKGVATAFGAMIAATPITAAISALVWLMSVLATKISSLAALSAALVAPVVSWVFYGDEVAIITSIISLLVWIRHKDNIMRITSGRESKSGEKKTNKILKNDSNKTI